jgi:acylphosphatase
MTRKASRFVHDPMLLASVPGLGKRWPEHGYHKVNGAGYRSLPSRSDAMTIEARRLRITGKVQGVWFRDWTVSTASQMGVRGWVRNRRDGSVEALAIGEADLLQRFAARCGQGPERARVDEVLVEPAEPEPIDTFERRGDA